MKRRSFVLSMLFLTVSTSIILQSKASFSYSNIISAHGTVNYSSNALSWLHTDGIYIKDAVGRALAWRGIFMEYQTITQNVIDVAKAHGATYIEVCFVPDRPGYDWYLDVNNPTHLSRLDNVIDLCEASGVHVILSCLDSSTMRINDGLATGWEDVVPIDAFKVLVQRYANRPVVCGIKFLDEPNFDSAGERQMYYNAIDALKPLNPNLLWVSHLIGYDRYASGYLPNPPSPSIHHLNPWQSIDQVPDNMLVDAGCWIGQAGGPPYMTFPKDDYASADALVENVIQKIAIFQSIVPIPAGMAYGCAAYTEDCSWTYAMREINRNLEINHMYPNYLISAYLIPYVEDICDRIMPDAPYPYFW